MSMMDDLRFTWRSLNKNRMISVTIILSLGLAIGINTAVFSVINQVFLNPLPFKDAERIVNINENYNIANYETVDSVSEALMSGPFFEDISGNRFAAFWISDGINPEKAIGLRVSGNPLRTLGIQPALGRFFREDETKLGAPLVVMLSHEFWQKKFNGTPDVIGKSIRIDGEAAEIVGILPKSLTTLGSFYDFKIWLPMSALDSHKRKGFGTVFLTAKLKRGKTIPQAQDWVVSVGKRIGAREDYQVELQPIRTSKYEMEKDSVSGIFLWMGVAAFILLIACANLANLLLTRSTFREKEFAIRRALGASRLTLIRLQLMESVILSLLGGLTGLLLAIWAKDLFIDASEYLDFWQFRKVHPSINGMVILFAGSVSLFAGIISGLLPALLFSKSDFNSSLKEGGQYSSTTVPRRGASKALLIAELTLAVILTIGAALMIKGLLRLMNVDPGIQTKNILTMNLQLPYYKYETDRKAAFYDELLNRIREIPGVELASAALWLPSTGASDGKVVFGDSAGEWVNHQCVETDYFQLMGIRLLEGRVFDKSDRANSPLVAVVSERFAKRFFPNQSALGKQLQFNVGEDIPGRKEIIGVVRDVHQLGIDQQAGPFVYLPFSQTSVYWMQIIVRTKIPLGVMTSLMQKQVHELDPEQPAGPFQTMEEVVSKSLADRRLKTWLLSILGVTGLLISMIGIYALTSYSVACRTQEIGIRMTVGAQKTDILKMITKQGAVLSIAGLILGIAGALALTRVLSGIIYGISPTDPQAYIIVGVLFLLAAMLANYFPARRATRVDPIVALRHE
jgi:putative ABC transport system permease protein